MTGPLRRLLPDDGDLVVRLSRFRAAHPDVVVAAGEFGTWQAWIPEENGETVITRHRLGELLDRLGTICPDLPARAAPVPRRRAPGGHARPAGRWPAAAARTPRGPRSAGTVT